MVHMQWKNDLVAGSDRFFSALGRAYWTDADPRGIRRGDFGAGAVMRENMPRDIWRGGMV